MGSGCSAAMAGSAAGGVLTSIGIVGVTPGVNLQGLGVVTGKVRETSEGTDYVSFTAIPYGEPPIGQLILALAVACLVLARTLSSSRRTASLSQAPAADVMAYVDGRRSGDSRAIGRHQKVSAASAAHRNGIWVSKDIRRAICEAEMLVRNQPSSTQKFLRL